MMALKDLVNRLGSGATWHEDASADMSADVRSTYLANTTGENARTLTHVCARQPACLPACPPSVRWGHGFRVVRANPARLHLLVAALQCWAWRVLTWCCSSAATRAPSRRC
jgi:hypothetical protein